MVLTPNHYVLLSLLCCSKSLNFSIFFLICLCLFLKCLYLKIKILIYKQYKAICTCRFKDLLNLTKICSQIASLFIVNLYFGLLTLYSSGNSRTHEIISSKIKVISIIFLSYCKSNYSTYHHYCGTQILKNSLQKQTGVCSDCMFLLLKIRCKGKMFNFVYLFCLLTIFTHIRELFFIN